jgi:hypothetical protein
MSIISEQNEYVGDVVRMCQGRSKREKNIALRYRNAYALMHCDDTQCDVVLRWMLKKLRFSTTSNTVSWLRVRWDNKQEAAALGALTFPYDHLLRRYITKHLSK